MILIFNCILLPSTNQWIIKLKNQKALVEKIKALLEDAEKILTENIPKTIASSEKALFKSHKIKEKNNIYADAFNQLASLQRINKEYSTARHLAQ